ncbi:MAG: DMT family transporter [bacterium]|nr:DMT family transporter [bacterium]
MIVWFLFALSNAFSYSAHNAYSKYVISYSKLSKSAVIFLSSLVASIALFSAAYINGIPQLDRTFWIAVVVTGLINSITAPMLLRAYQLGEFSRVFSVSLLTPVFLLFTAFIFLGEIPRPLGIFGVMLTVVGLWFVERDSRKEVKKELAPEAGKIDRGVLLAIGVALLSSVTVNFDKLAAQHSSVFFGPAVALAIMAFTSGSYLMLIGKFRPSHLKGIGMQEIRGVISLGLIGALSNVLFNVALLIGLAVYTIAIKRMGILFGILWGWLFFKEKDIAKKLIGAMIAIGGVVLILFS